MSGYDCAVCKDEGYLYLPGFDAETTAQMLESAPVGLYERTISVGVQTAYRCTFCAAADEDDGA